jgi:hypothetical protein
MHHQVELLLALQFPRVEVEVDGPRVEEKWKLTSTSGPGLTCKIMVCCSRRLKMSPA